LVQCRHATEKPIGEPLIRDFLRDVIARGESKGFFITSGHFSSYAQKFAQRQSKAQLRLVDGKQLLDDLANEEMQITAEFTPEAAGKVLCPKCNRAMIDRGDFWGCSNYPQCQGRRLKGLSGNYYCKVEQKETDIGTKQHR